VKISTHVLDIMRGSPAAGVAVTLSRREADGGWTVAGTGVTDADGRVRSMTEDEIDAGEYRLEFATRPYFERSGLTAFYPEVTVVFSFDGAEGLVHVPLLLSQFGYTTYKGV
jgi:5-hydroxyisourate hydrolase